MPIYRILGQVADGCCDRCFHNGLPFVHTRYRLEIAVKTMLRVGAVIVFEMLAGAMLQGQQPQVAVRTEIEKLRAQVKTGAQSDDAWKDASDSLARSEQALAAGRIYLSIEELGEAERSLLAAQRSAELGGDAEQAVFEAKWSAGRAKLVSFARAAGGATRAPLAIRALEEAARGQVMPLVAGSKAYATVTGVQNGMYYLGEAEGDAQFAKFCRTLQFPAKEARAARSITTELQALQQKANDAFKPPLSKDKHPQFIRLNSTLKLAEELNAAGLYAGAWYEYLLGTLQFAAVTAKPVDESTRAALTQQIEEETKRVAQGRSDDSLLELYLQQAQAAVDDHHTSTAGEWTRASLIVHYVVPAYRSLLEHREVEAPAVAKATTQVTLVRWPYT
jgi:hypothetical protein